MPQRQYEQKPPAIKKSVERIRRLWKGESVFVSDWLKRKYRLKKVCKTKNGLIVLARQEASTLDLPPKHVLLYYPKASQATPFIKSTRELQDFMSPGQNFPGALFSASYFIKHNHVQLNEIQGLFTTRQGHVTKEHVKPHRNGNVDLLKTLCKNALKHGRKITFNLLTYPETPTPSYCKDLEGSAKSVGLRVFSRRTTGSKGPHTIEIQALPPKSIEVPYVENYFEMINAMEQGPEKFEEWRLEERKKLFKKLGLKE